MYIRDILNTFPINCQGRTKTVGGPGPYFCGGPGTTFFWGPFPIPIALTNYNIRPICLHFCCLLCHFVIYMAQRGRPFHKLDDIWAMRRGSLVLHESAHRMLPIAVANCGKNYQHHLEACKRSNRPVRWKASSTTMFAGLSLRFGVFFRINFLSKIGFLSILAH